jgi:YD repeat-containing protein
VEATTLAPKLHRKRDATERWAAEPQNEHWEEGMLHHMAAWRANACCKAWLFALALLVHGAASAQFAGANPSSGHSVYDCHTTDVDGRSTKRWFKPLKGDLPIASVLKEAASILIERTNAIPPNCHRYWSGGPNPIVSVDSGRVGATWAGFSVEGSMGKDASCGPPDPPSKWEVAVCGCVDSRNMNLVGLGPSAQCYCKEPYSWSETQNACVLFADRFHMKGGSAGGNQCLKAEPKGGNPIYPLTGSKRQSEELARLPGQRLAITYDTRSKVPSNEGRSTYRPAAPASFGELWHSSLHKQLTFQRDETSVLRAVQAARGAGRWVSFARTAGGAFSPDVDESDRLTATSSGWSYFDAGSKTIETYDAQGVLVSSVDSTGAKLSYFYSDATTPASIAPVAGLLIAVQDMSGRSVRFEYESAGAPRIIRVIDALGQGIGVSYDASGNLSRLTWQDGTQRKFIYEAVGLPWALTGVVDEADKRHTTYGYDEQGRAVSTEYSGGVHRYTASYTTPPQWNVVETFDTALGLVWRDHYWQAPQGTVMTSPMGSTGYTAEIVHGYPRVTSRTQPAGSGCGEATSSVTYDASGNVASSNDFNGHRTCYAYDSLNRETARVEGLSATQDCASVIADSATLPAGSRKITSAWHPDWTLKTREGHPGTLSTYVYNGQPDPTAGNATASCAPSTALLPNGKPIAVLCKHVQQATVDANGRRGLNLEGSPASTGDSSFANVGLLLHMEGAHGGTTIVDSSAGPKSLTAAGDARTSTTQARFGASSAAFDGSGDYWFAPHSGDFSIQAGDFTVEAWVYRAVGGAQHYILSKRSLSASNGWELRITASNTLQFFYTGGSALASTASVPSGTWVHVAATRSGSTVRLFIGGVQSGSATFSNGTENTADTLKIGVGNDLSGGFNGYIDEVRITKGVARYTGSFTVPTTSFGNSANDTSELPSALDPSVPARSQTYTYNERGQVLTSKGPRTDVNDTTTYTYYGDTTADHAIGDLQSITNAVGKVTQYPLYNKLGQVLRSVDANGVATDFTYDARHRLVTVTVEGQTTTHDYYPTGLLKRVTQANGSYVEYRYDDAHRLVGISDRIGNSVEYTLDNAGNRTAEVVKDPSGALKGQLSRVLDALGRVQQVSGRQ